MAPLIIAGCRSDKLYYEHHQTWRLAMNVQARCRALTYQMTERSAYLSPQNAYSGNGFSPAATPSSIELAAFPPSEQAQIPGLILGGNRFRDQETCGRISPEKEQLNNLNALIRSIICIGRPNFYKKSKYVETRGLNQH